MLFISAFCCRHLKQQWRNVCVSVCLPPQIFITHFYLFNNLKKNGCQSFPSLLLFMNVRRWLADWLTAYPWLIKSVIMPQICNLQMIDIPPRGFNLLRMLHRTYECLRVSPNVQWHFQYFSKINRCIEQNIFIMSSRPFGKCLPTIFFNLLANGRIFLAKPLAFYSAARSVLSGTNM